MSDAAVERWRKTRTLIIDEISMLDGRLFDKVCFRPALFAVASSDRLFGQLEYIARYFRGDPVWVGTIDLPNGKTKDKYEYIPLQAPFGGMQVCLIMAYC